MLNPSDAVLEKRSCCHLSSPRPHHCRFANHGEGRVQGGPWAGWRKAFWKALIAAGGWWRTPGPGATHGAVCSLSSPPCPWGNPQLGPRDPGSAAEVSEEWGCEGSIPHISWETEGRGEGDKGKDGGREEADSPRGWPGNLGIQCSLRPATLLRALEVSPSPDPPGIGGPFSPQH